MKGGFCSSTAMRTGAMTAIGAKHLARPDARVLGHIGARGSAYWNVRLIARLFDRASAILRQLDHLPDEVAAVKGLPRGEVRLAMDGSIAAVVVAPLYRAMEARCPDVRVLVTTGLSHQMRQLVESRSVDLALMPNAFELPSLLSEPVYEEHFCLFAAKGAWSPRLRRIRFDDIGDRPLVAADRQHDQRKLIERVANARKRSLNVRYEINDAELTRALVRDGLAQAVRQVLQDPQAALAMGEAARQRALVQFSQHAVSTFLVNYLVAQP